MRIAQIDSFESFYQTLSEHGLRPGEFSVLWLLYETPGIRQGALARHLRIKRPHMTKMIQNFEERGLVTRTVPDSDRRGMELRLTAKGHKFVEERQEAFFNFADSELDRLDPEEAQQLITLLRKFLGF
ncbi:MarR family winged helix-turn-helix transcriptional regulator [Primorskyibacter sedentarius]|uniref:MarR family transcriptional regulator n=1 Tax=Primorskyibacter sedentarius TaxID=745311 RepID=A0A4V2UPU8_9RHOB|nr:MarR family transcriptional regulator [Primorskyibacter sedentarius]TCS67420.1 MarR family transcriptional regulator [Primorskyibacter sedentarius]